MAYESTVQQWREGERRLEAIEPPRTRVAERVAELVFADLRRRLGGSFSLDELVSLYEAGTSWAVAIAVDVAPADPWVWDSRLAVDAAFAKYMRQARDYSGGRKLG